jgi:hypothetical protein
MTASSGKPGSGRGIAVIVSVVPISVVMLELISDELVEVSVLVVVELDVSVLMVDAVDSLVDVADDVVVEVVLVVSMSIPVPQCTSIPKSPAAQPSSVARKLALWIGKSSVGTLWIMTALQATPSQWNPITLVAAGSPMAHPSVALPGTIQIVLRSKAPVTAFSMATRLHIVPS